MNIREHQDVLAFKLAASRFCELLEGPPSDTDRWVEQVLGTLAQVYAYGHSLPEFADPRDRDVRVDFDVGEEEWRRVYRMVQDVFGMQSFYWCYFDPSEPLDAASEPSVGDLADDLADIYRDIKPGLRAWETNRNEYLPAIVFGWKEPLFSSHWGVHAVSAMRALHPIAYLRGIQHQRDS